MVTNPTMDQQLSPLLSALTDEATRLAHVSEGLLRLHEASPPTRKHPLAAWRAATLAIQQLAASVAVLQESYENLEALAGLDDSAAQRG